MPLLAGQQCSSIPTELSRPAIAFGESTALTLLPSCASLLNIPAKQDKAPQVASNAGSDIGPLLMRREGIGYGALRGENRVDDLRQSTAVLDAGE